MHMATWAIAADQRGALFSHVEATLIFDGRVPGERMAALRRSATPPFGPGS